MGSEKSWLRKIACYLMEDWYWLLVYVFIIIYIMTTINESVNFTTLHWEPDLKVVEKTSIPEKEFPQNEIPVIVRWDKFYRLNAEDKYLHCGKLKCKRSTYPHKITKNNTGAYFFYGLHTDFNDLPLPRSNDRTIWGLLHEESPRTIQFFMHEMGLNLFNYSSTFSRHSDVPFPLHYLMSIDDITTKRYFIETSKKNSLHNQISPIMYLQSNCGTSTERDSYVKQLMDYLEIDSYGKCLNNKPLPNEFKGNYMQKLEDEKFLRFVARYKFVIAIESGVCEDYVTEKLWRAIKVGVVPIYFGSPSIKDWLPNEKSAILIQDYPTPKLLSQYINELQSDDELYEQYLEHKTKGTIRNNKLILELKQRPYQNNRDKLFTEFECFLCEKVHLLGRNLLNHVVNKMHYNCPEPTSVLTQSVDREGYHYKMMVNDFFTVLKVYHNVTGVHAT